MFKMFKNVFIFDPNSIKPYKGGANGQKSDDIIDSQNLLRTSVEKLSFYTTRLTIALIVIGLIQLFLIFY